MRRAASFSILHAVSRWLNAHTLPPRMPPTYGDLRSLSRRGTIYRAAALPKHRGQDGRGNLRIAKTPPLQSGVCGDGVAGNCRTDHHLRPRTSMGRREGGSRCGVPRRFLSFTPFPVGLMRIPCRPHASYLWGPTVFITPRRALNTADGVGGGIFALRRPRPYSRYLRGYRCGELPHRPPFTPHGHQWEGVKVDHDAARRVATLFESLNCLIKTFLP